MNGEKAVTDMGRFGPFQSFRRCIIKKNLIDLLLVVSELGIRPSLLFLPLPGKRKSRSIFTNKVEVKMRE
jgi:hypothetical protein